MAKSNRKRESTSLRSVPKPAPFPRLEGDDLLTWGRVTERTQQALQAKQEVARQLMESRGLVPGEHLLTEDGYFVTPDDVRRQSRVQSHPANPVSLPADPAPPDSGS